MLRVCGFESQSVLSCPLMVRWVVGSIPHGRPIEFFLVPASSPQLVYQRKCMRYPLCGVVNVKCPLLLNLSDLYHMSDARKHVNVLSASLNKTFASCLSPCSNPDRVFNSSTPYSISLYKQNI